MATSDMIAAADHTPRPLVFAEDRMSSAHVLAMPAQDRLRAALERDLARICIARATNRHDCEGLCERPEHARDVADAVEILRMLGLKRGGE